MARLQDFPSVTPTDSDKILVVQSQSQGLATFGSTLGTKMDKANPTGTGSLSINRKANTTTGSKSVAVGDNGTASGSISTAMGSGTTASGNYSLAAGSTSTASGNISTAFGSGTTASGAISFASGISTTASGDRSQAMGTGTIAKNMAQHVFGEWNVADPSTAAASSRGNYVEIVGKGTNDANRSNARTLDWSGNEVLAGDLKIGGKLTVGGSISSIFSERKANTTTGWIKSDGTFTLAKGALLFFTAEWNSSPLFGLGVSASTASSIGEVYILAESTTNKIKMAATFYLPAGTYSVWLNLPTTGNGDTVTVYKLIDIG